MQPSVGAVKWLLPPLLVLVLGFGWCTAFHSTSLLATTAPPVASAALPRARGVLVQARGPGVGRRDESKRQARVAQLVRAELSQVIRQGTRANTKGITEATRQKISIVDVHMSPDLRNAKVFVSVFASGPESRQAYAWLVQSSGAFRHELSQELRHMRSVPALTFRRADVAEAVDVMVAIDNLNDGRARTRDEEGFEDWLGVEDDFGDVADFLQFSDDDDDGPHQVKER
uniref:Ribosome-binding factor A n=1 Tax=Rhizochromulina marina TaxID=1034831 RepID=A0A7S2SUM5_9STRA|mmetsp:Transcript_7760/g.22018  ORF Transcript_7760/g.22018 Transcript_7760/m.22018 type:complete len:229 (+) Transcript_7760:36-722(+)